MRGRQRAGLGHHLHGAWGRGSPRADGPGAWSSVPMHVDSFKSCSWSQGCTVKTNRRKKMPSLGHLLFVATAPRRAGQGAWGRAREEAGHPGHRHTPCEPLWVLCWVPCLLHSFHCPLQVLKPNSWARPVFSGRFSPTDLTARTAAGDSLHLQSGLTEPAAEPGEALRPGLSVRGRAPRPAGGKGARPSTSPSLLPSLWGLRR